MRSRLWTGLFLALSFLFQACAGAAPTPTSVPPSLTPEPSSTPTGTPLPADPSPTASPTAVRLVPNFAHIVIIIFENHEFGLVIGSHEMPEFNRLAADHTLLTQFYAPAHPSLPNYLALIGGDTFGITSDCDFSDCFINAPSLPDLIEQSGRTWRAYQEHMPEPCFKGSTLRYVRKHDPFIFFDPIRSDGLRCARSVVPLTQLQDDISSGSLPDFIFITPDICSSAHDCGLGDADAFLKKQMDLLQPALDAEGKPYLVVLTWDEGQGDHSCCGLPASAGGRVATVLVSPQARAGFKDVTPYSHYSLLKTIAAAWGLPELGHAADAETTLITAPWIEP